MLVLFLQAFFSQYFWCLYVTGVNEHFAHNTYDN